MEKAKYNSNLDIVALIDNDTYIIKKNTDSYNQFIGQFGDLISDENLILKSQIQITKACDQKCDFCYQRKEKVQHLSLKTFQSTLDILESMDVFEIQLVGGEAALNPYFREMINYAYDKGFSISLITNGHWIRYPKFKELRDGILEKISFLQLSVNNIGENYSRVTGIKDNHENLKEVLNYFSKYSDKVLISSVIDDCLTDELYNYVNTISNYGFKNFRFGFITKPINENDYLIGIEYYQKSLPRFDEKINKIKSERKDFNIEVLTSTPSRKEDYIDDDGEVDINNFIFINIDLDVYPFPTVEDLVPAIGNVKDIDIRTKISKHESKQDVANQCIDCNEKCVFSREVNRISILRENHLIGRIPCYGNGYQTES